MDSRIDVHQHVWTEPLVAALARRDRPPRVRSRAGRWILELRGEPAAEIALDDPGARADLLGADGLDRALVALSSPLGIEALPRDEATALLDAFHDGAFALPAAFGVWGAVALDDPDPADVDALLDRGAVGVSLPAGALATPAGLDRVEALLERLERRDAPLLVHPGPAPWSPRAAAGDVPGWWPALTTYVGEQAAAWLTFVTHGRPRHPGLRVVFAALAGLAPLHAERLEARSGHGAGGFDRRTFYDTSSYGRRAIAALAVAVGPAQVVYGSDRPVVEPRPVGELGPSPEALLLDGPARLLGRQAVLA
ncbi:MAG TPA: hypothetical protein VHB30_11140 [Solirubrobacteraceae bacterium]|nr:hypothetical protein [Solirubrobacteraceae bacterium]